MNITGELWRLIVRDLVGDVERVGFVLVVDEEAVAYVPCANHAPNPRFAYELTSVELALVPILEAGGRVEVAIAHSHVSGPAFPSSGDLARGRPGELHLIYSVETGELRAFRFAAAGDDRHRTRLRAVELAVVTLPN